MERVVSQPGSAWLRDLARKRPWLGIVLTGLVVAAIILSRPFIPIATPGNILLLTVAVAAVLGGVRWALVSAAIAVVFAAVDASDPSGTFTYTADQFSRLVLTAIVAPSMAILVGAIKGALDRESAASEMRRSEERQRAVTETVTDAIVVIDDASTVRAANPAAEEMFGIPRSELIGASLTELMPESFRDRHLTALRRYTETGRRSIAWRGIELTARHRSGREFPVEVSFGEYHEEGERRITGVIRDISHRKELENQLLQAQKMEAVGQLAGGVAHDFNNSLTAISGFAELMESDLASTPHARSLASIRTAADQAAALTRQLLAFARRQELQADVVDVNRTLARVEPMLRRLLGEDLTLDVRPGADVWPVFADPAQLETILINLAVNSRDAMPAGGTLTIESRNVTLDNEYARQHVEVTPGPYVMVAVSDTGHGIDPEVLPHIFEPFYTTKSTGAGTGLGLATVHGIVKQSGGHIWVYSEPGRGTTFKVYLPRTTRAPAAPEPRPSAVPVRATGASILVAEDEPAVRALLIMVLERHGYRVLTTASGIDALEVVRDRTTPIDLIVTDVVMPGMSGPELIAEAATLRPGVPALFISGYTANALAARDIGQAELLEKPFRPDALIRAVRSLLGEDPSRD